MQPIVLRVLTLVVVLGLALAGRQDGSAKPVRTTMAERSWTIAYSPSMPPSLSKQGREHFFDFPTTPGSVHYVIERAPAAKLGQVVTMFFKLEGAGRLLATEGGSSAKVRLFMQQAGDTLTAQDPHKRWWSVAHVKLVSPGTFILSAKIEPGEWSSVFGAVGTTAPAAFADCVAHLAHLGFTFGGDFAGHGVYVTDGAVRFFLKQYSVL